MISFLPYRCYFILYTTKTNALRKKETDKGLLQTEVKLIGLIVK